MSVLNDQFEPSDNPEKIDQPMSGQSSYSANFNSSQIEEEEEEEEEEKEKKNSNKYLSQRQCSMSISMYCWIVAHRYIPITTCQLILYIFERKDGVRLELGKWLSKMEKEILQNRTITCLATLQQHLLPKHLLLFFLKLLFLLLILLLPSFLILNQMFLNFFRLNPLIPFYLLYKLLIVNVLY